MPNFYSISTASVDPFDIHPSDYTDSHATDYGYCLERHKTVRFNQFRQAFPRQGPSSEPRACKEHIARFIEGSTTNIIQVRATTKSSPSLARYNTLPAQYDIRSYFDCRDTSSDRIQQKSQSRILALRCANLLVMSLRGTKTSSTSATYVTSFRSVFSIIPRLSCADAVADWPYTV